MPRKKGTPWKIDLVGQKFGKWSVVSRVAGSMWLCRCDCGIERPVSGSSLTLGKSKGCWSCHSRKHGMEGSTTYNIWAGLIQRCTNPKSAGYPRYGGRGINVCDRWRKSFAAFLEDMGERPDGLSIERINNAGNYEPSNCKWATQSEQIRNRKVTVFLEYEGIKRSLAEWAELYGIKRKVLANRINKGWSVKDALTKPKSGRCGALKNE